MKISLPQYRSPSKSKAGSINPGATFSLGYPILFHGVALAVAIGLLLLAANYHITPLLWVSIFLLVIGIVSRLWSRQALRGVTPQLSLSQNRAFPGESIALTFGINNSKWLAVPWLEIEAELPSRLATGQLKTLSRYSRERLRWTTSISGGQLVRWKYSLECKARGEYRLGPLRLRSGDILGLFPKEMVVPDYQSILVYPRIVPVDKLVLPLKELAGERAAPRNVYEDISRTMGARDYQAGDPFKHIHWKASASHNGLKTRQYESTTGLSLVLMLDVHSFCQQPASEESFELAVSTTASLAYAAHREDSSVGLMANSMPEIEIPIHSGRSQQMLILEALARIQARSRLPLAEQLDKSQRSLPVGTTLVIVTSTLSPSLASLAQKLQQKRYSLVIMVIGQPAPVTSLGNMPVLSIQSLGDLSRSYGEVKS